MKSQIFWYVHFEQYKKRKISGQCCTTLKTANAHLRRLVAAFLLHNHGHFPASLGWSWTGGAVGAAAGAEWLRTSQMRLGSRVKVCSICGVPDVHPSVELAPSNYNIRYITVQMQSSAISNIRLEPCHLHGGHQVFVPRDALCPAAPVPVPVPAWSTSSTAPSSTRVRRSSCWGVLIIWAQCLSLNTLTMSINKNVTFCKVTNVNKLLIYWCAWRAKLNTTLSERYSYHKVRVYC